MLSMTIITPGMSARYSSQYSVISVTRVVELKNFIDRESEIIPLLCLQERRKINKEIDSFRRFHQRAEDRRDYDLYDPEALKKSLPTRVDDNGDDPNLGAASAQKCVNSLINIANNIVVQPGEKLRRGLSRTFQKKIKERACKTRLFCFLHFQCFIFNNAQYDFLVIYYNRSFVSRLIFILNTK